jgi:hypothetical protein
MAALIQTRSASVKASFSTDSVSSHAGSGASKVLWLER